MGRRENVQAVNYQELEGPSDDEFFWCEKCSEEYKEKCPNCGPHHIIEDTPAEEGDPLRARKTLPAGLYLEKSRKHGLGVFAERKLKIGLRFGPYEGIRKGVGDPAQDSGYAFEIEKQGEVAYLIDAQDEATSNWMRYVNCACNYGEQNVQAFQYKSNIYYCTITEIKANEELLVWYGDNYARTLGLIGPSETGEKSKSGKRKGSRRKGKRKLNDITNQSDENTTVSKKRRVSKGVKPKKSSKVSRKTDVLQKKLTLLKQKTEKLKQQRKSQFVDNECNSLSMNNSPDNRIPADETSEDTYIGNIDMKQMRSSIIDSEFGATNYESSEAPDSGCYDHSETESPAPQHVSENLSLESDDEVLTNKRYSLHPQSTIDAQSTSSLPLDSSLQLGDIILISDDDSVSDAQSRDRSPSEEPETRQGLSSKVPTWRLTDKFGAGGTSPTANPTSPTRDMATQESESGHLPKINKKKTTKPKHKRSTEEKTTQTKFKERSNQSECENLDKELEFLRKELEIKNLEAVELQLKIEAKMIDKEIFQLDQQLNESEAKVSNKNQEIRDIKKEISTLREILMRLKSQDPKPGHGNSKSQVKMLGDEVKQLKRELEIKNLENSETELEVKIIFLEEDKSKFKGEFEELERNASELKRKRSDASEKIRDVQRKMLRLYRLPQSNFLV